MPIKREELEKKWYYRAAKVLLIALPFVIIILWLLSLLRGTTLECTVVPKYDPELIKKMVMYFIVGLGAYFILLVIGTWAFFYLVFGGIEEAKRKDDAVPSAPKKAKASTIIPFIIFIIVCFIIAFIQLGKTSPPEVGGGGTSGGTSGGSSGAACRQTSAEWGLPCGTAPGGGPAVLALPIPDRCDCPVDTYYSGTTDVVTPGGPYKLCLCK